jgi:hypothetical protein
MAEDPGRQTDAAQEELQRREHEQEARERSEHERDPMGTPEEDANPAPPGNVQGGGLGSAS